MRVRSPNSKLLFPSYKCLFVHYSGYAIATQKYANYTSLLDFDLFKGGIHNPLYENLVRRVCKWIMNEMAFVSKWSSLKT